jgi:hypothetical protein
MQLQACEHGVVATRFKEQSVKPFGELSNDKANPKTTKHV